MNKDHHLHTLALPSKLHYLQTGAPSATTAHEGPQSRKSSVHTSCTPGAAATTERSNTEKGSPSMVVTAAPASCAISTPAQVSHGLSRYSQYPSEMPAHRRRKACWIAVKAAACGRQGWLLLNSRATVPASTGQGRSPCCAGGTSCQLRAQLMCVLYRVVAKTCTHPVLRDRGPRPQHLAS